MAAQNRRESWEAEWSASAVLTPQERDGFVSCCTGEERRCYRHSQLPGLGEGGRQEYRLETWIKEEER